MILSITYPCCAEPDLNLPPVANLTLDSTKHPISNSAFVLEQAYFLGDDSYDPDLGNNLTYYWEFGDGSDSYLVSPTHIYHQIGEYIVRLTVNDSELSDSRTMTIIVISERDHSPIARISLDSKKDEKGNNFANVSEPIIFDASMSYDPDGSQLSYEWDFGVGEKNLQKIVTHEYEKDSIYTVVLTVSDDELLISKDSISITIGAGKPSTSKDNANPENDLTGLGFMILGIIALIIILLVLFWLFLRRLHKQTAARSFAIIKETPGTPSSGSPKPRSPLQTPEFTKPEVMTRERAGRQARAAQLTRNEAKLKQVLLRQKLQEERKKVDDDMKKELEDMGIDF